MVGIAIAESLRTEVPESLPPPAAETRPWAWACACCLRPLQRQGPAPRYCMAPACRKAYFRRWRRETPAGQAAQRRRLAAQWRDSQGRARRLREREWMPITTLAWMGLPEHVLGEYMGTRGTLVYGVRAGGYTKADGWTYTAWLSYGHGTQQGAIAAAQRAVGR